jgi:effector-binding domain-containing protein
VSYGQLGTYVTEHALAVAGPVRETYLTGPRDTGDSVVEAGHQTRVPVAVSFSGGDSK